jgi:hypothetical protein
LSYVFDEFHKYTENLISAQYNVSEIIQHELTKGEVREEFVMDTIQKGFSNTINLKRGFLQVGSVQSNQMDILLLEQNAPVVNLANQTIVSPESCKMVLEVKGNATGNDLKEYNDKIAKIKDVQTGSCPLFGVFCYRIKLTEKTILNRFGFTYDISSDYFYDEYDSGKNVSGRVTEYPNIDFLISIEIDELGQNKQFYLRKNDVTGRYIKSVEYPVLKNLFSLTHSLLLTP